MGIVRDLARLDRLERANSTVYVHYEIIPNSDPPFLACIHVGGALIRPHITGFPAQLRRILVSPRRKVITDGPFREAVEGRYIWGETIQGMIPMEPQYHFEEYHWGDLTYTEEATQYLEMRVRELRQWDTDRSVVIRKRPLEEIQALEDVVLSEVELNTVSRVSVCRVRRKDLKPFAPVNLMNANLISYLATYTFSPPDSVYQDWADSMRYKSAASITQTTKHQAKNHDRMLARGSTQINTCTSAVIVGTFVRMDTRVLGRPEEYASDPNWDSVNGSVPWSDKAYKVISVIEGTDISPKKYVLQDLKGTYFRGMLCPIENLELSAIVRIRLSTIAKWLMANGTVKVRERHFKFNHSYSRALFRIARIEEIPDEGRKFFLDLVWNPKSTFKYSEWEVDEAQNLWSYRHYEDGERIGIKPFTGFHTYDLLRVDQQTEILMRTDEGQEKYRECLLRCMNLGKKATYMDDEISKKRMKKDPIDKSRTKQWKTSFAENERLRKAVLLGLPAYSNIFQAFG